MRSRLRRSLHMHATTFPLLIFCMRDNKRAAAEARAVLRENPEERAAMCNLSMSAYGA